MNEKQPYITCRILSQLANLLLKVRHVSRSAGGAHSDSRLGAEFQAQRSRPTACHKTTSGRSSEGSIENGPEHHQESLGGKKK